MTNRRSFASLTRLAGLSGCLLLGAAIAACGSSKTPEDTHAPPGSGSSGGGTPQADCSGAVVQLDAPYTVSWIVGFYVDAHGMVFAASNDILQSGAGTSVPSKLETSPLTGPPTTLITDDGKSYIDELLMDDTTIYFSDGGDLQSMPRAGGPQQPVFPSSSSIDLGVFALSSDSIYLVNRSAPSNASAIMVTAKAGGTPALVYTSPANVIIDALYVDVDGSTLYWSESDANILTPGPTTIRSAPLAPTLTATDFGTVPTGISVVQLVASAGRVAFNSINLGGSGPLAGLYTLERGAQPDLVDGAGGVPLAIEGGVVYYNDEANGVSKLKLDGSAPSTVGPASGMTALAVDPSGAVYYSSGRCVFKL